MPNRCVVYKCNSAFGFKFPSDKEVRKRWIIAVRRDNWAPTSTSVVCPKHFLPTDYKDGPTASGGLVRQRKRLKPNVVPSVFYWVKPPSLPAENRKSRAEKRPARLRETETKKRKGHTDFGGEEMLLQEISGVDTFLGAELEVEADIGHHDCNFEGTGDNACTVIEVDAELASANKDTQTENITVATETQTLITGKLHPPYLSVENLKHNSELLHYYTGLVSYKRFHAVFNTLGPAVHHLTYWRTKTVSTISPINQFLLMLGKLRQDIDYLPLSNMCGVSKFTAENVYITWINFCSRQWGEIDTWVPKELVGYYAPSDFKQKFPSTRVILDGTEVPIEKPSNPATQRATFSSYKNKNTVKAVIGSTPGGLVSYVSQVYGGSVSDRQIIERSNIPLCCDPGDSVMADKGFNVQDLFAPKDVLVNIPAFFSKKNRLTEKQVLSDRKVSSKRVHIERIIGMGKTYKVFWCA